MWCSRGRILGVTGENLLVWGKTPMTQDSTEPPAKKLILRLLEWLERWQLFVSPRVQNVFFNTMPRQTNAGYVVMGVSNPIASCIVLPGFAGG